METSNAEKYNIDDLPRSYDEDGRRVFVHPIVTQGTIRKWQTWVRYFLIVFFLALPWILVGGRPLLLFDIEHRNFFLFGVHFHAHDAPLLAGVLISFGLAIALITTLWGRLWCGWACPQTVYIEGIFRKIEEWIEGDAIARRQLDRGPATAERTSKRVLKWICFSAVGLVISHSTLALFVGAPNVLMMMQASPLEHPASFIFVLVFSAILTFEFGWMREQFCMIICPYGKLQSVFMDRDTRTIAYDLSRSQDCIDCKKCIQVCPTAIDIRNGTQLECIACGSCIDACNGIMSKLKRPLGLIRYTSERQVRDGQSRPLIRPRTITYASLLVLTLSGLAWGLQSRHALNLNCIKVRGQPFTEMRSEDPTQKARITNTFSCEMTNLSTDPLHLSFQLEDASATLLMPNNPITLEPGVVHQYPLSVIVSRERFMDGVGRIGLLWKSSTEPVQELELPLVGPLD
jgi:cytochrome c oxidase accessory protein FixG